MLLFVGLANAVVDLYVRGVARAAVDEGARAGAAIDASAADCQARAHDVLDGVVAARTVQVSCRDDGGAVRAHARVLLDGWIPGIPDWTMDLEAEATKEDLR